MERNGMTPGEIVAFWRKAGPDKWFARDAAFDKEIARRYGAAHAAAVAGDLDGWPDSAEGALALILVLDQFSRNLFRNDVRAFAADAKAREIAERAIANGFDQAFDLPMRRFVYMPFMHSESLADQQRCIALCTAAGDEGGVKHARIHAEVIRRFGRFPHRNRVLGRTTRPDEQAFLDGGGFAA